MKKYIKSILLLFPAVMILAWGCKDSFLDDFPPGLAGQPNLSTKSGADGLLIGAYALLDGNYGGGNGWQSSGSNWVYGSIVGGDAHKGSNSGDQSDINPIMNFSSNASNGYFNNRWEALYSGIARCNSAIRIVSALKPEQISDEDKNIMLGEARFLRAHYHFEAKRMWNIIPFVDETITYSDKNYNVPNNLTSDQIWDKIQEDMNFAYTNLPGKHPSGQVGRANKWNAGAYLGKILLYRQKFPEAKTVFDDVILNGTNPKGEKYALAEKFHMNFQAETDNNPEMVFSVQNAYDAAFFQNGAYDQTLEGPYNAGIACCGFYQPSFDLVNSYRTDAATGLPVPESQYNGALAVKNDMGIKSSDAFTPDAGPLDPRLDWTAGRRGIPYLDWGKHPGQDWIRDQTYAGPYSSIKNIYNKSEVNKTAGSVNWGEYITAINFPIIRFADVLLMAAEAEVEAGSLEAARGYVNQVRARAANPDGFVMDGNVPAANYVIKEYATAWLDQNAARDAVRFERKLELAMEGHRFFDLVRWGIAQTTLNHYVEVEKGFGTTDLTGTFSSEDTYYPIPQAQIDLEAGALVQTPGH